MKLEITRKSTDIFIFLKKNKKERFSRWGNSQWEDGILSKRVIFCDHMMFF